MVFDGRNPNLGEKPALEVWVEDLRPGREDEDVEAGRVAEGLAVKQAMQLLGLSWNRFYRQVHRIKDYGKRSRESQSAKHTEALHEVAFRPVEVGIVKCAPTPCCGVKKTWEASGRSRMSCYQVLKSEGLIQPKRIGHESREAGKQRRGGSRHPRS